MAISDAEVKRAEARLQSRLKSGPRAVAARYDRRIARVVVRLDSGLELAFPPTWLKASIKPNPMI